MKAIKHFDPVKNIWYIAVCGLVYLVGNKELIETEYPKFERIFNF